MMTGTTLPTIANASRRALPKGSNEPDPIFGYGIGYSWKNLRIVR
jgi:hypothetical protein